MFKFAKECKATWKNFVKKGLIVKSQRDSHRNYIHPFKDGKITIPFHNSKDLPLSIERNVLKKAGLLKEDKKHVN